ncbi:hypothetical protein [Paenibacillus whitsoniae]|uniref:Uncharacterized protein n=1 Tax=Paenibacillus whitsoniae TaxID=2496558 RepID=A0A430J7V6_9BACL|nr:hypothetical protein [Paenibacillus whitsoniae]RTE05482.1 hypothetical protein EJQ19_24985 [Paenibacillus whitsoniae]
MATTTPKLGLPRPESTDNVTRANNLALIDAIDNSAAPVNNPVFTGTGATLPADPTTAMHAATKQYVDDKVASIDMSTLAPKASPAFTGNPTAPTPSVDDNDTSIATTGFVIGQASTSTPAMDGVASVGTSKRYARADHIHPTDTSRAPVASPTFTGTVTLPGDPTSALHATTKQYVDTVGTTVSSKVSKTGDTLTGNLITSNTSGSIAASTTAAGSLEVRGNGGSGDAAFMSFHRPGAYGAQFGLDSDNKWKVGGWSTGAAAYELWHDNRLRVHSSGKYLEWNNGGTWYPVSGNGYYTPSASTVIQSDATERSITSDNQYLLVGKFLPLFTGEVTISADIHSNGNGFGNLVIYAPVNPLLASSTYLAEGYRAANTVNTTTPVGTVLSSMPDVLNVATIMSTTSASYVTQSVIVGVTANIPLFLFATKQLAASATCFVRNLAVKGDTTRY